MIIDINTKMVTLISTPPRQSFAVQMQNAGYQATGLNMVYSYTEANKGHLGDTVNGLRYMNFAGFAVTKPNKVWVLRYLDELDPLCQKMGASNTVVKTLGGKLVGYNTDGIGFYTSLTQEGGIKVDQCVLSCLGGDDAGRAICPALVYHDARKTHITDVFEPCAKALVVDINASFAPVVEFVHYGDFSKLSACDVVMNASGVEMGDSTGRSLLPKEYMQSSQFYFDACYNPEKTQFLLDTEEKGCRVLNRLGMSLYQDVVQIEPRSRQEAPVEAMRRELMQTAEE